MVKVQHKAGGRCVFDHLVPSGRRGALNLFPLIISVAAPCISLKSSSQTGRQTACSDEAQGDSQHAGGGGDGAGGDDDDDDDDGDGGSVGVIGCRDCTNQ